MSNKIIASHRNKNFVTQAVNAFRERDVPGFLWAFSQHGDPAKYKQIQDRRTPSDYALLSEIMTNVQDQYGEGDAYTLLLTLGQHSGLSELARLGVYFATIAYVPEQDRKLMYGEQSHLHLNKKAFGVIIDYFNTYEGSEFYTGRHDMLKFYQQSVIKDQSPKDFLLNIEVAAKVGVNFLGSLSRLGYEDKPDGPSAYEQYQEVLGYLSEPTVYNMLGLANPSALTYEMVKKHGLTYAHPIEEFTRLFLPQAFENEDLDIFKGIFSGNIYNQDLEQIQSILGLLTPFSEKGQLTELQEEMRALVDTAQKAHHVRASRHCDTDQSKGGGPEL